MKIVVVGGSGLIGSKVVTALARQGHEVVSASRVSGLDATTSVGLPDGFEGASVVVDATESPSFQAGTVLEFFWTSTRNMLLSESLMGVEHHVALSVVGTDRLSYGGYFAAKVAQERLIRESEIPYSIVRTTQFFEFIGRIADDATLGDEVRLAPVQIQPVSADDVAAEVSQFAVDAPLNGVTELAGPELFKLDELVARWLKSQNDPRRVVTNASALLFGTEVHERTLLPGDGALRSQTRFQTWLDGLVPAP